VLLVDLVKSVAIALSAFLIFARIVFELENISDLCATEIGIMCFSYKFRGKV
jgi:hypothetical protein